jgi:S1-C subfamily serine protease
LVFTAAGHSGLVSRLARLGRAAVAAVVAIALFGGSAAVASFTVHRVWQRLTARAAGGGDAAGAPFGGFGSLSGVGNRAADAPSNAEAIAARVSPAVVDIDATQSNGEAAGTGMVLTQNGEVLTNNHVIAGATGITVTDVGNGRTYSARVLGYDRSHDVALLALIGASNLATVTTASSAPADGTKVVGVGNAGGQGGTPSYAGGSIVGVGRSITASDAADGTYERLANLLVTDADIVAGDSGGPLVDSSGAVIGMDTAASGEFRFSGSAQAFAIPIGDALQIAAAIGSGVASATTHVGPTALLGVEVNGNSNAGGALIADLVNGGPAETAGLIAGDTIRAVDGHQIGDPNQLSDVMTRETPGRSVRVDYTDTTGAQHSVTVRLGTGPPQ